MDDEILRQRQAVYERAKAQNPQCWSGQICNWSPIQLVFLNPDKSTDQPASVVLEEEAA